MPITWTTLRAAASAACFIVAAGAVKLNGIALTTGDGASADAGRRNRTVLSGRAGGAQSVFHRRKKDVQGQVLDGGVGLQQVAQTFGHREHAGRQVAFALLVAPARRRGP